MIIKMPRYQSPFMIYSNSSFINDEEQLNYTKQLISERRRLEKIQKEIFKPVYRMDSFRSMPLDLETSSCCTIQQDGYHNSTIGVIFSKRNKPKLTFNSMIQVHVY
jgi:hypothetical protein